MMAIRLLIAEPDDALRDVFERCLSRRGFMVETAGTLGECVEKVAAFEPHVIMSELDFSDGSNDQVFRLLFQNAAVTTPIVVVTRRNREKGTHIGWPVAEYFEKPISMSCLAKALCNCAKHPAISVA